MTAHRPPERPRALPAPPERLQIQVRLPRPGQDSEPLQSAMGQGALLGGRYRLGDKLGRGGMGVVYRAQQLGLDREVVVKLLDDDSLRDAESCARFSREAQALSMLNHEHIVSIHDFGQHGERSYIVMELVEGLSLEALMREHGILPWATFCTIATQLVSGVAHAHSQGIVHRDIKPSNIMLATRGANQHHVKVLDFGLAQLISQPSELTSEHTLIGSVPYLAPERILGLAADARADIYALGVLFYAMLCGQRPFHGTDPAVLYKHIHEEPLSLLERLPDDHHVSQALLTLIHDCLAKHPDDRPRDARALAPLLERALRPDAPLARRDLASAQADAPTARVTPLALKLALTVTPEAQEQAQEQEQAPAAASLSTTSERDNETQRSTPPSARAGRGRLARMSAGLLLAIAAIAALLGLARPLQTEAPIELAEPAVTLVTAPALVATPEPITPSAPVSLDSALRITQAHLAQAAESARHDAIASAPRPLQPAPKLAKNPPRRDAERVIPPAQPALTSPSRTSVTQVAPLRAPRGEFDLLEY